jgi:hypothetical protein
MIEFCVPAALGSRPSPQFKLAPVADGELCHYTCKPSKAQMTIDLRWLSHSIVFSVGHRLGHKVERFFHWRLPFFP